MANISHISTSISAIQRQQNWCLSFRQFIPEVYFVLPSYDQQYRTMAINI